MRVRIVSPAFETSGYGAASRDYIMALKKAGVEICIQPILDVDNYKLDKLDDRYEELIELAEEKPDGWEDVVIVHAIPAGFDLLDNVNPGPNTKKVFITTWETDKFPDVYAEEIKKRYDLVLFPSYWNTETAEKAGLKAKRLPHCFDPNFWFTRPRDPVKNDLYTFYAILTWCSRKNPMGLLLAYLTEFTQKDNVLLKIRSPGWNRQEIDSIVRGLGLSYYPPVDLIGEHLTEDQLLGLHLYSDCYVSAAKAEGWGLGAFEAFLVGNPVIATGYSGLLDFMDLCENSVPIPYQLTPAFTPELDSNSTIKAAGLEIKPILRNDHTGIRGDQEWADPDLHEMKKWLREAYNSRWEKSDLDREMLAKNFSYDTVGNMFKSYLESL